MDGLRVERAGRVLTVTLDNPPHGLLTAAMVAELDAVIDDVDTDPGIGAVVLTGAHPERFVAHYDVADLLEASRGAPSMSPRQAAVAIRTVGAVEQLPASRRALRGPLAEGLVELRRFHGVMLRIGRSGAVFVAALNGSAMGGGCELAMACDLRLMASGPYVLGQLEILLGFLPGGGGTQRLTRLIGRSQALELALEGRPVSSEEAERLGLVHRVVPADELLAEAHATAERLARRSKPAVAGIKRAVLEGGSLSLEGGIRVEQAGFVSALSTDAAQRAIAAYLESTARTGELPAYDTEARAKLIDGTFVDLTDG